LDAARHVVGATPASLASVQAQTLTRKCAPPLSNETHFVGLSFEFFCGAKLFGNVYLKHKTFVLSIENFELETGLLSERLRSGLGIMNNSPVDFCD
jgi:hypothetical protein